jgi:hypothetical protein
MKQSKKAPLNTPANKTNKLSIKLTPRNQVILAAVAVLVIFMAALLSSIPKKENSKNVAPEQGVSSTQEENSISQNSESQQTIQNSAITNSTQETNAVGTQANAVAPANSTASSTPSYALPNIAAGTNSADSGRAIFAAGRVKFKISSFKKLDVQPLKFQVFDVDGKELTPEYLNTVSEQKIHFVLVTSDLRQYQHLNPKYADGQWNVSANMPTAGTYYAYLDFTTVNGKQNVLRSELIVRNPTAGTLNYPGLTPNLIALTDGITALMSAVFGSLGAESKMTFSLTGNGVNVTNLMPYAGSFGYTVILRHTDPDAFLRTYPTTADDKKGIVDFNATFKKTGRYTAFGEFKIGGKVSVFPITFDVK